MADRRLAGRNGAPPAEASCLECGATFTARASGPARKFCGASCRKAAHARRHRTTPAPAPAAVAEPDPLPDEATCATPECGEPFSRAGRMARKRFCSDACRERAQAQRKQELEALPDHIVRPYHVGAEHEQSPDPSRLKPPPLPWETAAGA